MWDRRSFLKLTGSVSLGLLASDVRSGPESSDAGGDLTVFLCGDVMTGRGIDQALHHSVDPRIHESYVRSALDYVTLAERANGPVPRPLSASYVWGDALDALERFDPALRIINLETSVTKRGEPWPGKGIHYRMHPKNVDCLAAAGIDCCVLANNHVLDWGYGGLADTLQTLRAASLPHAGAGADLDEASSPAIIPAGKRRGLVFAFGHSSSGIPSSWGARKNRAGVNLLPDLSERTARAIAERVIAEKRPEDIAVASIHWGGNWGYRVPDEHRTFAHRLIDLARIDVVHGHSSHHPRGVEVYRGRPILYGCGDLINDYEGIRGHEEYRSDLSLLFFPRFDPDGGGLRSLTMVPMQIHRFRLRRAAVDDSAWLHDVLGRECEKLGCRVKRYTDRTLALRWDERSTED